jgi:hypothetical protein
MARPDHHHDHQDDEGHQATEAVAPGELLRVRPHFLDFLGHLALPGAAALVGARIAGRRLQLASVAVRLLDRDAAEAEDLGGPPETQQDQDGEEGDGRAGDIRQIRTGELGDRELAGYAGQRSDDRQRPSGTHSPAARHEVKEHPRRRERQDGHDLADRGRERKQPQSGYLRQSDDRSAQSAEGDRRVVGDGPDAHRLQFGDAEGDEYRGDDGPRIAESD